MDAKVVPKSSPEAKSIGSQLEGYESDEVEDLNHDAHGLLRETDPQYPNMDEEGSDAYEMDNSSDLNSLLSIFWTFKNHETFCRFCWS